MARAILAFLVLPGTVAFVVPLALLSPATRNGFLAPWAPPRHLVVTGPYRFSRSPMYVAVVLVLLGWAVGYQSWRHWLYAAAITGLFHARILLHEEPFLDRTHGELWTAHQVRVPRWFRPRY